MIVQAMAIVLSVAAAFTLPAMANYYVAIALTFSGLGMVLVMLYRTRCPDCSFPIAMNGPANLRAGAGAQRINYCPHCGKSIDVPYGSNPSLQARRPESNRRASVGKERYMQVFATAVAYIVSLAVVAAFTLFAVLILAGPHAGMLPSWLEPVVLGAGWLAVLVLPVLVARAVWRRTGRD